MASTAPTTTSRPTAEITRAGFTLLELLTVLLILSMLMGIGVGAFKKVSLGRALAVSQVKDALRQARLFAIEESATSQVEIDAQNQRITASGFVLAGNWHFEDEASRGWPSTARLDPGIEIRANGAIGKSAWIVTERASIDLGRSPSFDADQGFALSLFVKPTDERGGVLASKGKVFTLSLEDGLRPRLIVRVKPTAEDATDALELECDTGLLEDRWNQLEARYDGRVLALLVGGRVRAEKKIPAKLLPVLDPDASLRIGAAERGYVGGIDEVRFAAVVATDSPPLPNGVRIAASGIVHFDDRGRLDAAWHSRPVDVELLYEEDQRSRTVTVGLLGEVE